MIARRARATRLVLVVPLALTFAPRASEAQSQWRDVLSDSLPLHIGVTGSARQEYALADVADSGRTLALRRTTAATPGPQEFGATAAIVDARPLRGQRIRLGAMLRAERIAGSGSLWLRIDGANGSPLALENNMSRGLHDSTGWVEQRTTLTVADGAERIYFGALLSGTGTLHVKGLSLETSSMPSPDAPVASEPKALVDSVLSIARAHSLWRDTIGWTPLTAKLRGALAGAESVQEAYPVVVMLVAALGDHHSRFMTSYAVEEAKRRSRGTTPAGGEPDVEGRMLARDRVGYLMVPAHGGFDESASRSFVERGREQLVAQAVNGACGWVVDLRKNGGGAMYPMLAMLAPFFGDDALGSFVAPEGTSTWTARGVNHSNDRMLKDMSKPERDLRGVPVAVLLGARTASSGEAVAISFVGRKNTRSFGEETAGLTTGNRSYPLPGGAMLYLTTTIEADRLGHRYGGKMSPDVVVAGDAALDVAQAWLLEQPGCRAAR